MMDVMVRLREGVCLCAPTYLPMFRGWDGQLFECFDMLSRCAFPRFSAKNCRGVSHTPWCERRGMGWRSCTAWMMILFEGTIRRDDLTNDGVRLALHGVQNEIVGVQNHFTWRAKWNCRGTKPFTWRAKWNCRGTKPFTWRAKRNCRGTKPFYMACK